MKKLFGTYTAYGYTIFEEYPTEKGRMLSEVYRAGNCQFDSAQTFPLSDRNTLPLDVLAEMCDQTGKEMADESGAIWTGCSHDVDGEEEIAGCFAQGG